MAFVTQASLQTAVGGVAKLGELTNDTGAAAVDAVVVADAIAYADSMVAGYVAKRYSPSDAERSPAVLGVAAEIGARWLRRRRGMHDITDEDNDVAAVKWLTGVSDGSIALVDAAGIQIERSELIVDKVGTRENIRALTRAKLNGFS